MHSPLYGEVRAAEPKELAGLQALAVLLVLKWMMDIITRFDRGECAGEYAPSSDAFGLVMLTLPQRDGVTLDAHVPADTPHRWDVLAEAVAHHLREAVIANGNGVDPAAPLLPPLAAFLFIQLTAIACGECRGIEERTAALRRLIATGRVRAMLDPR